MSSSENISSVEDSLTSCWTLLESAWSVLSENKRIVSSHKLRHALSACKTFLKLSIEQERNEYEESCTWWFYSNIISAVISTILFLIASWFLRNWRVSIRQRKILKKQVEGKSDISHGKSDVSKGIWNQSKKKKQPNHQQWAKGNSDKPPYNYPYQRFTDATSNMEKGKPATNYPVARMTGGIRDVPAPNTGYPVVHSPTTGYPVATAAGSDHDVSPPDNIYSANIRNQELQVQSREEQLRILKEHISELERSREGGDTKE